MAEAEGKSGDEASLMKEMSDNTAAGEKKVEESKSSLKSSWSGWFQKMNDAVLGAIDGESKEESKEENKEEVTNSNEEQKAGSWGAWGTSLLQQAKEKTLTTFELVKKDLTEFTDVVQNETASIVSVTASTIRERAPQLVGGIVGTVNTLLVEDTTRGEEDTEIPITATAPSSRSEARLYAIQSDPGTYCNEPEGAPELFDDWLDCFKLEDNKDEISHLLVTNPTVRNMFAQLVPSQVSNTTFWQRYFYKLHQFELDEARRRALLQREEAALRATADNVKLSWGDESEPDDHHFPADNAETDNFYDVAKEVAVLPKSAENPESSPSSQRQQSPVCCRDPPEGVNAIPKSWKGEKRDSLNVEMKSADDQDKQKLNIQTLDTDISSISSLDTPKDGESSSPTDKKSDDWVEWENDNGN